MRWAILVLALIGCASAPRPTPGKVVARNASLESIPWTGLVVRLHNDGPEEMTLGCLVFQGRTGPFTVETDAVIPAGATVERSVRLPPGALDFEAVEEIRVVGLGKRYRCSPH